MPRLLFHLLGPSEVTLAEGGMVDLKYDKALALLAFLAVEADRAHRRDSLAGLLWPELPQKAARNNLRQALLTVREAIGDRDASPPFLHSNRLTIQFNRESDYHLDVEAFVAAVAACERHAHRSAESCLVCTRELERAVALYHGPFLEEFSLPDSIAFEEWALLKREWLNGLMVRALDRLAIFHQRRGNYSRAATAVQRQLALEPWREPAHRHLMRLYALQGNLTAAVAHYESCRALLAGELGVEPEEETTGLYRQIRDNPESVALAAAAGTAAANRPYRVPYPPTPFVGRERELEEIGRLVDSSDCRLLTLVGPGGVGKTRLALQVAADQANLFVDGIFYIDLASMQAPELLPETIAAALDLDLGGGDPAATLLEHLQDKEMLLVLDNMEQLLAQPRLLERILRRAPAIMLLVTSRERLNLRGERIFPVLGFAVEPLGAGPEVMQPAEANPAIQLFLQAARRASGDFSLSSRNLESVLHICELVDGLPLGIELAAAWTRVLPCADIAAEMERSFRFLTSSLRDLPPRHRSIESVFDRSWMLLAPHEQRVLAALSVFEGTILRQAAEEVAGATLPNLAILVDKSLLQRHPTGRYALHPLLRQYTAERLLEAGDGDAVRDRHLAFFRSLAEQAEDAYRSADQAHWLERLAAEEDNLRAALRWAQENMSSGATAEQGLRLAVALYRYWYWRSHFREGLRWLEAFLTCDGSAALPLRARALYTAGVLASQQDDYRRAERYLEESLALWRRLGDQQEQAACLNSLGILAWSQHAYEQAQPLLEQSLALRRAAGQANLGPALNSLGLVALAQGQYVEAERYFSEQLLGTRSGGNDMGTAIGLSNLGVAVLEQGRVAEACGHLGESLALFKQLGDREGVACCLEGVAAAAIRRDEPESALLLCAAAATLRTEIHAPLSAAERPRYERTVAAARSVLGTEAILAAATTGQELGLNQVIARALALCHRVKESD